MSEENYAPLYTVTLADGLRDSSGSLAWAVSQANAYTGEGVPTIAFAASLAGSDVGLEAYLNMEHDMRFVNLGSEQVRILKTGSKVAQGSCVTLGEGVALGGSSWVVEGALVCEAGSGFPDSMRVASSGLLRLNGARVKGKMTLEVGARMEGKGATFAPMHIFNWANGPAVRRMFSLV